MRHVGMHRKPAGMIFEHYLEALDRGDTFSFEKDLCSWIDNSSNNILILELRRIWFRIIDGDLEGRKQWFWSYKNHTSIIVTIQQHIDFMIVG